MKNYFDYVVAMVLATSDYTRNILNKLEFEVLESELDGEYQNATVYYIKPTELRLNYNYILGIQSFTSLNAELHQDINGALLFLMTT